MRNEASDEPSPDEIGPRAALTEQELALVGDSFGLGAISRARDLGGTYNLNVLVEAETGRYVIRVHRPWLSRERLAQVQAIRRSLARTGMPVPEPVAGAEIDGILRLSGRLVEVDPFVEHDAIADTWERYRAAFPQLAKLHDTLTDVVPATLAPPRVSNYGTPPQLRRWTENTRAMIERDAEEPDAAEALARTSEAQELLRVIDSQRWETEAGLPRQPIHGDYGGGNVLFRGGEIVAVLDFDFLGVRERVYELAYTTFWMLRRLMPDASPAEYPWSSVGDLLAAYQEATKSPILPAEWDAIPLEMARVPLYWVAEAGFTAAPVQSVLSIAPVLEISRWLLKHAPEITRELQFR